MKRTLVGLAVCTALFVAAPATASAAKAPAPKQALTAAATTAAGFPFPPLTWNSISCTLSLNGKTQTWNFNLPSFAVPYFQTALAQLQQYFPALTCTVS
jgi:hypothetical protein